MARGLGKPLSRRGLPPQCAHHLRSGDEDKQGKYRQQRAGKRMRCIVWAVSLAVSGIAAKKLWSASTDEHASPATALRSTPQSDIARRYQPKQFNRKSGYKGRTYAQAADFCAGVHLRHEVEGKAHGICPFEVICPGGRGTKPLTWNVSGEGVDEFTSETWLPILNEWNEWIQVGVAKGKPQCSGYSSSNRGEKPSQSVWKGRREEEVQSVICCVSTGGAVSVSPGNPSHVKSKQTEIEKSQVEDAICGHKIGINLAEESTWPTPSMPKLDPKEYPHASEVVLLKKGTLVNRNLGESLSAFFHAYDAARDAGRPIYITQDSWAIDVLLTLFFGRSHKKSAQLWDTLEKVLQVKIIENEGVLKLMKVNVPEETDQTRLFYEKSSQVTSEQLRNHRETLLRKLFRYPAMEGDGNVCSAIGSLLRDNGGDDKKYTVVHLVDESQKQYLPKLNKLAVQDLTDATQMRPEYIKSILRQTNMLGNTILPIDSNDGPTNASSIARIAEDSEIQKLVRVDNKAHHVGSKVYLAVMADVYIGNPVDHLSFWVARMRYALGMKDTYILTEKKGDDWVSYIDADHLELYDNPTLGPWMG